MAYRVVYRIARKQHVETFAAKQGADAFEKDLNDFGPAVALEHLEARTLSADATTVTEWVAAYIELIPNITDGTRSTYRSVLARHVAANSIGRLPVDQLNRRHVETWVIHMSRDLGLSGKTIKNVQALLSAAMTRAVRDGVRASNPCVGVRPPTSTRTAEMVFLTGAEFAILRDFIPEFYRPLVGVLYGTGMRWSEATALRVMDVDLAGTPSTIHVARAWKHTNGHGRQIGPPKSRAGDRHIALPPQIVTLLSPLVAGKRPDDLVFVNRFGNVIRQGTFHASPWTPAVKKAEAIIHKHPRIHDLRHSHASQLIRQGVPLNIVQRRLGHEKITTTLDTYGHLAEDHLSVAAQAAALALTDAFPELEG